MGCPKKGSPFGLSANKAYWSVAGAGALDRFPAAGLSDYSCSMELACAGSPDRWKYVGVCALAFLISAGVRVLEAPRWDAQLHRVDGEYLLATHDAYAWVTGAVQAEAYTARSPMALLLACLSGLTKIRAANLAYWLPAVLAPLSAIPIALWAAHLGARAGASLASGVLGSLAPAFYSRTRLGYFDTDWATLFFPLLVSLLLAIWIRPYLRGAGSEGLGRAREARPLRRSFPLLVVIPISMVWHGFIPTHVLSILWLALALLVIQGERTSRAEALRTLLALSLAAGAGWIGAWVGLLFLFLFSRLPPESLNSPRGLRIVLLLLLCLLIFFTGLQFQDFLTVRIAHYLGTAGGSDGGLAYPDPGSSVREAQEVSPTAVLQGAAFLWWLGVAGLIGFGLLVIKRPAAVFLAPLLVLGILSLRMGVRFAMFAAPVLWLGALVPVDWLLARSIHAERRGVFASSALFIASLAVVVALIQREYARLPIETVLTPRHAAALRSLRLEPESEGLVWTWWDYGYASEYFSGLASFANGGRNTGEYLFTLGRVLGSDDLASTARLMAFSAAQGGTPWRVWEAWEAGKLDSWFERLPEAAGDAQAPIPQYLIAPWEAIALLPWVQYYGSWSFDDRVGQLSDVRHFSQPLELDLARGTFLERGGQSFSLSTADLLDESGSMHYAFPHNASGPHLLMRLDSSATYLLDDTAYRSTLVRLLLEPEDSLTASGDFELLVDGSPDVRVFRLR